MLKNVEKLTNEEIIEICAKNKCCATCKLLRTVRVKDEITKLEITYSACERKVRRAEKVIKEYRKIMEKE